MVECLKLLKQLESPCIIVTDADKSEFPESMEVFTMPTPKYFWMNPLAQHLPFDLVAGYIAELKGIKAFREGEEVFDNDVCKNRLKSGTEVVVL